MNARARQGLLQAAVEADAEEALDELVDGEGTPMEIMLALSIAHIEAKRVVDLYAARCEAFVAAAEAVERMVKRT